MIESAKDRLHPKLVSVRERLFDHASWRRRGYSAPAPRVVKNAVILRNAVPSGIWVETGTYLGQTTAVLSRYASHVYSLEPAELLYRRAARKFARAGNVTIINGPSETEFAKLLPTLKGPVNFWLDGHFSAGDTYSGDTPTPIQIELAEISRNLARLQPVAIMIDDIRLFAASKTDKTGYPPLEDMVTWAGEHVMQWHIEHDIFIMRSSVTG